MLIDFYITITITAVTLVLGVPNILHPHYTTYPFVMRFLYFLDLTDKDWVGFPVFSSKQDISFIIQADPAAGGEPYCLKIF